LPTKATKYLFAVLITIFFTKGLVPCQEVSTLPKDTVTVESDTANTINDTTSIIYRHNPARAAFLSAVVPGLGQIYNGKGLLWRLPILYAGIGFEIGFISYMNNQYQLNHTAYVNYTNYISGLNGNLNAYSTSIASKKLSGVIPASFIESNGTFAITPIISGLKSIND
jgi:hypothetical protein